MLTVVLSLPPRQLSPNHTVGSRGQRLAKASKTKAYRRESREAAMIAVAELDDWQSLGFPWTHVEIQTAVWFPTVRFMDADNTLASMKAAYDGLVDAGVLTDDREVTHLPVQRAKDSAFPRVELTIIPRFRR